MLYSRSLWVWKLLSHVRLFVTPWPLQSMEFSRLEYWSGYRFLSPWDLPNPGVEPRSPALQADSLPAEPQGKNIKLVLVTCFIYSSVYKSIPIFQLISSLPYSLVTILKKKKKVCNSAVVQLPSPVQLFVTPWTVAGQASLSLTISQSLPKFMSIASVTVL